MTTYYYPGGTPTLATGTVTVNSYGETGGITFTISDVTTFYHASYSSGYNAPCIFVALKSDVSSNSVAYADCKYVIYSKCTTQSACSTYCNSSRNAPATNLEWGNTYVVGLGQYQGGTNVAIGISTEIYYGDDPVYIPTLNCDCDFSINSSSRTALNLDISDFSSTELTTDSDMRAKVCVTQTLPAVGDTVSVSSSNQIMYEGETSEGLISLINATHAFTSITGISNTYYVWLGKGDVNDTTATRCSTNYGTIYKAYAPTIGCNGELTLDDLNISGSSVRIKYTFSGFSTTEVTYGNDSYIRWKCSTSLPAVGGSSSGTSMDIGNTYSSSSACIAACNRSFSQGLDQSFFPSGTVVYLFMQRSKYTSSLKRCSTSYIQFTVPSFSVTLSSTKLGKRSYQFTATLSSESAYVTAWQYSTDKVNWTSVASSSTTYTFNAPGTEAGTYYVRCMCTDGTAPAYSTAEVTVEEGDSVPVHDMSLRDKSAEWCQSMPSITNHDMSFLR